jgi:Leucine-rich repeat (LRR) protein
MKDIHNFSLVISDRRLRITNKNKEIINSDLSSVESMQIKDFPLVEEFINLPYDLRNLSFLNNSINLTYLDCSCCCVNNIPSTIINIRELYCRSNIIHALPKTLVLLEILDCTQNYINKIPDTYTNLKILKCKLNSIQNIPETLVNLKYVEKDEQENKKPAIIIKNEVWRVKRAEEFINSYTHHY